MRVSALRINYIFYNLFIFCAFLSFLTIVPDFFNWTVGKLSYLFAFIFFSVCVFCYRGRLYAPYLLAFGGALCFLAFSFVSSILNFPLVEAIKKFFGDGVMFVLAIFVVSVSVNWFGIKKSLWPFYVSVLVGIFLSIMAFFGFEFTHYGVENGAKLTEGSNLGLLFFSGMFVNQNTFGVFLVLSISVIFLHLINGFKFKITRLIDVVSIFVLSVFLVGTVSRASMLAAGVMFIPWCIRNISGWFSMFLILMGASLLALVVFFLPDVFEMVVDRSKSGGASGRTEIWSDAIAKFMDSPIVGIGEYSYQQNGHSLSAHNVFLQKLVNSGFFVFVFWASFFVFSFFLALKATLLRRSSKIAVFLGTSIIAFLVHQVFETTMINSFGFVSVYFYFLFFSLFYIYEVNGDAQSLRMW